MSLMTTEDVDAICGLVDDLCGIALDRTKDYLIENRFASLMKREGCESYAALAQKAKAITATSLRTEIIDTITTNETLFFRDTSPFEALQHKVIPEMLDLREKSLFPNRLRIWSAACSTGQEAYSLAITIKRLIPNLEDYKITIVGTDISDAVVRKASRGRFAAHEIERGLPPHILATYFTQVGTDWQVHDEIRAMVSFQHLDLRTPFHHLGLFDIVFCRNVAIYFTPEIRADIFHRITKTMVPDGVLFVGASESLGDLGENFRPQQHCRATFYRPNDPALRIQ